MAYNLENRRQHERHDGIVLTVYFDGSTYESKDWSLGGLRIGQYDGIRTLGALITISALGTADSRPENVDIRARVVRIDDDNNLCLNYLKVDQSAFGMLSHLATKCTSVLQVA